MLRLGWLGTYVETQHDDRGEIVVGGENQGEIDLVHDQHLLISEARLALDVGLSKHFALAVMLPVRAVNTSIRYLDFDDHEVQLAQPGIHHRNETVSGLGDPTLLGVVSGALGSWRGTGRLGFTVPIGRTEEDPFTLGELGLAHQHIQMGTGTVNPVIGAELARGWGAWHVGAFALSQQVIYENGKGYTAGDRYAGGLVASRTLGERWSARGSVEAQGETAEHWAGVHSAHTDDGNRGRFDLLAGAAASWRATEQLSLDVAVKVPVVTRVVGGQLKMPAIVELGLAWSFGDNAKKEEAHDDHDHDDHDHAHEHPAPPPHLDTTGLDVADLGRPGEAVDLVAVAGKQLTIFDFWAPWCEPCKLLEPELIALVREYPDRLALRRINIVDWESAVAARYLTRGGIGIPHVKVLEARGAFAMERTTDRRGPAPLIEAIRALLALPLAGSQVLIPAGETGKSAK